MLLVTLYLAGSPKKEKRNIYEQRMASIEQQFLSSLSVKKSSVYQEA